MKYEMMIQTLTIITEVSFNSCTSTPVKVMVQACMKQRSMDQLMSDLKTETQTSSPNKMFQLTIYRKSKKRFWILNMIKNLFGQYNIKRTRRLMILKRQLALVMFKMIKYLKETPSKKHGATKSYCSRTQSPKEPIFSRLREQLTKKTWRNFQIVFRILVRRMITKQSVISLQPVLQCFKEMLQPFQCLRIINMLTDNLLIKNPVLQLTCMTRTIKSNQKVHMNLTLTLLI